MTGQDLLAAAVAAAMLAPAALAADRADVEAAVQRWQDAFNAQDAEAVADMLYTEDARLHPPDGAMVQGRDAIVAFWKGVWDSPAHDLVLELVDTDILSDTAALEIGTWTITVPADGGGEMQVGGKTLVVWKLGDDGVWRMSDDMWNDGN